MNLIKFHFAIFWLAKLASSTNGEDGHVSQLRHLQSSKTPKNSKSSKNSKTSKSGKESSGSGNGKDKCPLSEDPINAEVVRTFLSNFVSSLDTDASLVPSQKKRAYHEDADRQVPMWHICTVVQQCLDPHFMLSLGIMSPKSRGLVYKTLSKIMSQEAYNMLQLQQHSNMLLGEMQDWATTCEGTCHELDDPAGQLGSKLGDNPSTLIDNTDYDKCGKLRSGGRYTFWRCDDEPRMLHQANINTVTAQYSLGNIFIEPHIHGRNSQYDYFSVFGDLSESGGAFGLRFSGHHLDLNFMWDGDGELISDTPVFLGHNPLIVILQTPPLEREHDERSEEDQFDHMLMWQNMAGVTQFAEGVDIVLQCANALQEEETSYIPLKLWNSVGHFGGLDLKDGKSIEDYNPMDLSKVDEVAFDRVWALIDYSLKFSRGKRSTSDERDLFREEGKAVWTTSSPPEEGLPLSEEDMLGNLNFFYVRAETDEWVFFCMVNQLFTLVSESEATYHLHSILVRKEYLNCDNACCPGDPCP
jgi:hypothetical protein